ncbi:rust resistance kinase Lr10 isoform X2 [Quercus suber]|uniref:rust resistance kinase Lr10 isoform X2 n=1 Tax=Quercus suber TaxID=58331 RepID=UPI0032E038AA
MYSVPSVPDDIWDSFLELKWSEPAKCGRCERKGKSRKIVTTGSILGSFLLVLVVYALYRVYRYDKAEKENQARIEKFLEDYKAFKPARYSYNDVKRITNQFTEKLGQGAYGTVFKGNFSNEIHVAVKILNSSKGNGEEFINEVGTMGRIHHVNVVRLVGFCADGFRRALVYEFLPNDSLEKFTSSVDSKRFLGWEKLQGIALGIAKGIEYLHQGCDQRILHFDIKPHNILLDQNFNPKISDFGLAKLCAKDQSAVSMTTARGTMGYIAPEVFSRNFGSVSYKSDVYSFGILLLEMVGGRKNVDVTVENTSQIYFPEWIYNLLELKEDLRAYVEDNGDAKIAKKLAVVGLWCIQWHPVDRPSMKVVVQMLEGEGDKLTMPPNPFASTNPTIINLSMPARRLNQELEVILESE